MKVQRLEIENIRCFENAAIDFSSKINVIVGPNNNGKTTLLNCVSVLQQPRVVDGAYKRFDSILGTIMLFVEELRAPDISIEFDSIFTSTDYQHLVLRQNNADAQHWSGAPNNEPYNFIIPYQSKRKVTHLSEGVTLPEINNVTGTLSNLNPKIDRIANPDFEPAYSEYVKVCKEILGFRVSTTNSNAGKKAAYIIRNEQNIPIDMMGEGVSHILGLIVDLCRVENKLFIIEEPENDIHPKALRKLLDLIIEKSSVNQFIITTHSNIVLRYLGAVETTRIFNIEMEFIDKIPTSTIRLIDTPEKRIEVLEDLGYELFDNELWEYWLFLEEASAEKIIRDILIPWFVPRLNNKIKTFSAKSISQVAPKFEDFNKLFVYVHLQNAIYKNKAWVIIDAGKDELEIINELRRKYTLSGWNAENFSQFSKHDFEEYYPERFQNQVKEILSETDRKTKQAGKESLLKEVVRYCQQNEVSAKEELRVSAKDVIEKISSIGSVVN